MEGNGEILRRYVVVVCLAALLAMGIIVAAAANRAPGTAATKSGQIQRDADNAQTPGHVRVLGVSGTPTPSIALGAALAASRYVVLIVLDGAQPQLFNVPKIPHVRALIKSGVDYTNAWAGILESETPSGHAAIGTGSEPRNDGILSFDWANSDNTQINLFDPSKIRDGDMERLIAEAPAPTIADMVHARYPHAKVVALGGHKYYAVDAMGGPHADAILYYTGMPDGKFSPVFVPGHAPPSGILTPDLTYPNTHPALGVEDHLTMKMAMKTFRRMGEQVTLINLPEFDWPLGHVNGGTRDMKAATTLMQGFDADLAKMEKMLAKKGVLNRTDFVLLADHGMSQIYHTVVDTDIKIAVAKAGAGIIDDTYHTASYLWIKNESLADKAALNIAALKNPYIQSVYFRSPLPHGGHEYIRASSAALMRNPANEKATQYLLNTFNGPDGPDLAVFFTEGAASLPGGESSWKGDHGGTDWNSQHLPLIISGPGARKGVVSSYPARLEDVAPTLLTLIGARHSGMQGIPLADALAHPTPNEVQSQEQLRAKLMPVVSALQRESQLELAAKL